MHSWRINGVFLELKQRYRNARVGNTEESEIDFAADNEIGRTTTKLP